MPRPTTPPSLAHVAHPRRARAPLSAPAPQTPGAPRPVAVVGAGMAGITAARTLARAGWHVTLLDKGRQPGGRMATRTTEAGTFDHGAQFFTVRDARLHTALQATQAPVLAWHADFARVLDAGGQPLVQPAPPTEIRWLPTPGMQALPGQWVHQLLTDHASARLHTRTRVQSLQHHAGQWWLRAQHDDDATPATLGPFDAVVLALPAPQAEALLQASALAPDWCARLRTEVHLAPCWTLLAAFAHSNGPLGPTWDAARCQHPRVAWAARETSKPGRHGCERWVVQASPAWSAEHLDDDAERVAAKLLRGLADVAGLRAEPTLAVAHRWRYAQTQRPLGEPYLWDRAQRLGLCGDWCLGHRVEQAFVSGLELALAMLEG